MKEQMTFSDLLNALQVHQLPPEEKEKVESAIRRTIYRMPQKIDISGPLPNDILVQILKTYARPRSGRPEIVVQSATNVLQQINVSFNVSTQVPAEKRVPAFKEAAPPKPKKARKQNHFKIFAILAAAVFVIADGYSCGVIGMESIGKQEAFFIFAVVGMAVGYSSIAHIVHYKGYDETTWMVGFALFQLAIHLSSSKILGDYSIIVGMITITFGLMISTLAIAQTIKRIYTPETA